MVKYTIGDALKKGIALLKKFDIPGAATDAAVILGHILEYTRLDLVLRRDDKMEDSKVESYFDAINRRTRNEPVSYITGTREFMSLEFEVSPEVLIPRPDTEILVETVMEEASGAKSPRILDMCTGSGAIAVSLAKYIPDSLVTGLDISSGALDIARRNADRNGVRADFELHDVLLAYKGSWDVVVSNPPYIPCSELDGLMSDVADYEPRIALDGGEDGLGFYRKITCNAAEILVPGGLLAFEVGMGQAGDVAKIMEEYFEDIHTRRDLAGIERVVHGRRI